MKNLTLGSLFDGIGGWQIAAVRAGIKPVWSSEIAPFPAAVTAKHFPETLQMGDITKLDGTTLPLVDIICAGSPCQGLSLAGKRRGLQDERSGLFIKSVEIFRQMRVASDGEYPRFFVWENVPGAFSSNRGEDFQAVLAEIGQADVPMPRNRKWAPAGLAKFPKCDIAWRTLDAQFWGVPQRRRRIFLVADFAKEGRCAAEILFIEKGVRGNHEEGRESREETAAVAGDSAQASSWCIAGNIINRKDKNGGHHLGVDKDVSFTLNTIDRHAVFSEDEKTYSVQAIGHIVESEKSSTLAARDYKSPRNFVEYQKEVPLYDISHLSDGVREIPKETDDVRTVRRLTVTECERLQGLPDGYTDVPLNGKPASESERLKAIGNGMAQPCADFVLRQLAINRVAGEPLGLPRG
ncbi:DNA cytosine methyltransferase [Selenomonas bovis]|uniref:DNA cytosine methyltransferase n=1 Tax=Selenomonas bovis TaxID=416586 RepID=UPI003D049381